MFTRIVKVPFASAVLLFLSLSQLSLGLYVQPSANIKGCEYSIFGSPPYIVMPYKGYVFIITREITTFDIHILRLDDGKIVNSFYIEGLFGYNQSPIQVLLCPSEKRLVLFGGSGSNNYIVFDITNPEKPVVVSSLRASAPLLSAK